MKQATHPPASHSTSVESFIAEVEAFAAETNLAVSTICNRATNKTTLIDRMRRKATIMESDIQKVRSYMAETRRVRSRVAG